MMRFSPLLAIVGVLLPAGCIGDAAGSAEPAGGRSDPKQTVARMLELAEAGDWAGYVDDFYGETHKFRNESDRQKLIERYEGRWGAPVIEMLKQVSRLEPRVTEDGTRAIFDLGAGQQFTLYRDGVAGTGGSGVWKFHL